MKKYFEGRILTVPNLLSLCRLLLIGPIVWLYIGKDRPLAAAVLLLLSALTDSLDGFIARRFHQVSDLGKALDPVADKLTQMAVIFCLLYRFPRFWPLFIVLCVKEVVVALTTILAIRSSGNMASARWHGKITTTLLYAAMTAHLLWPDLPALLSYGLIYLCLAMLLLSGGMYLTQNLRTMRQSHSR